MNIEEPSYNVNNEILSQTYSEGVKRIRQHMNIVGPFELSNEILMKRQQAWNKLFEKYSENKLLVMQSDADDIDMNIENLNLESKNKKSNNEKNDDTENVDEFFFKCRAPMRKHPTLIQYWIDTGNPPYQLLDEINSDTGSSLSETEHSKSTLIILNQRSEINNQQDNSTSLCSSVDTAAYILSNTNVTKKMETIAIVEGAKNSITSAGHPIGSTIDNNALLKNISNDLDKNKTVVSTIDTSVKKLIGNKNNVTENITTSNENINIPENSDNSPANQITHNSMKITDILPTLAHLDKIMSSKTTTENQQIDNITNDENLLFEQTRGSFNQSKPCNRKKLYTARNSPIDIIVSALTNRQKLSIQRNSHPALSTPIIKKHSLFSKRRKSWIQPPRKKRLSQIPDTSNDTKNKTDDSEEIKTAVDNENKIKTESKGFSQTTVTHSQPRKTLIIAEKSLAEEIHEKKIDNSFNKNVSRDAIESPNESQCNKKLKDLIALCSMKNLKICLERCKVPTSLSINSSKIDPTKRLTTNTTVQFQNKLLTNVHDVDVESRESDQSTILICKCANNLVTNLPIKSNITNKSKRKSNEKSEIQYISESQIKNKLNLNGNNGHVIAPTDKPKKSIIRNQTSTIIYNSLSIVSEDNSSTKSSPQSQSPSKKRLNNSRIIFSSDEEDDFVKLIRENVKKNGKNNNDTSSHEKSPKNIEYDRENLIKDLTCYTEDLQFQPTYAPTANLTIVESDIEEIINTQKLKSPTKKINTKQQITTTAKSSRIKSILRSSVKNVSKNSTKSSVVKILQYTSSTDSFESNEDIITTSKKLKIHKNIESRPLKNNSSIEKYNTLSSNCSNTDVSQWNEHKKKNKVHFNNETNEISMKNEINKTFPKLSPHVNESCLILKNVEKIHDDDNIDIINKKKKTKRKTQNFIRPSRMKIQNKSLSYKKNLIQTAQYNKVTLDDTSSDDSEKNHKKLLSEDKTNNHNTKKNAHSIIFSNLLNDSSSDESLKFKPPDQVLRINDNNKPNRVTITFRTRLDDSDFDEYID